jgi:hypothetical protein
MSAPKIPGGNRRLRFGKHEGNTFAKVYNKHRYYVLWVLCIEGANGSMKDLKMYFAGREGITIAAAKATPEPIFIGDVFDSYTG